MPSIIVLRLVASGSHSLRADTLAVPWSMTFRFPGGRVSHMRALSGSDRVQSLSRLFGIRAGLGSHCCIANQRFAS